MMQKSRKKCLFISLLTLVILICFQVKSEQNFNDLSVDIKPGLETNYFPTAASAQSNSITQSQIIQKKKDIDSNELDTEENLQTQQEQQKEQTLEQEINKPDQGDTSTDQSKEQYYYDTHSDTIRNGDKSLVTRERLKPICQLNEAKITRIRELIGEQALDLFDKSVPQIDFSLGSRVESFDYSGGDSSVSPGVSASLSFPLYQPDIGATRTQKQQAYLTQCLTTLNTMESNWYTYQTLSKKLEIQRKLLNRDRDIKMIDGVFDTENQITQLVANINQCIRYFDILLKIKIESW